MGFSIVVSFIAFDNEVEEKKMIDLNNETRLNDATQFKDAIQLREYISTGNLKEVHRLVIQLPAPELAQLIGELPRQEDIIVFRLLPRELAADTFEFLEADKQQELLQALAHEQVRLVSLLNDLSPDDRTALLEELPG